MKLEEKYTIESLAALPENKDKVVLSNESYAICDFLERVVKQIEKWRINNG